MKKVYRFQYNQKMDFAKATSHLLPLYITNVSLWFAFLIIHTIIICNAKKIPLEISITSLILFVLITIIACITLFHCFYFSYNNSITDVHWDFNQEITVEGSRIISRLTFGEDTLVEELFIRKVIRTKKGTVYYQDRHHYVTIPNDIIPVEEEGNQK